MAVIDQKSCTIKSKPENDFNVCTYSVTTKDKPMYTHWSEGLTMIIQKGNISITLNEEEIREIVDSLPKTIGGSY